METVKSICEKKLQEDEKRRPQDIAFAGIMVTIVLTILIIFLITWDAGIWRL